MVNLKVPTEIRDRLKLSAAINKRTMLKEIEHLVICHCKTTDYAGGCRVGGRRG